MQVAAVAICLVYVFNILYQQKWSFERCKRECDSCDSTAKGDVLVAKNHDISNVESKLIDCLPFCWGSEKSIQYTPKKDVIYRFQTNQFSPCHSMSYDIAPLFVGGKGKMLQP